MKVNAILLKPLDGYAVGAPRAFEKDDFERLRSLAAVREATDDDDTEAQPGEDAILLEHLRHPVDGPRVLADLKRRFESMESVQAALQAELAESRDAAAANAAARDAHIAERDAAIEQRDNARDDAEAACRERDAALEAVKDAATTKNAGKTKTDG